MSKTPFSKILRKIHCNSFKTLDDRASGLHSPTSPWAWSWPWGWYEKEPTMFFIGPVCWQNSLSSCLQLQNFGCQGPRTAFSNTSVSLKLALRLISKSTNNVFHTASMLNKISEVQVYSLKVLDARASGLHFPTPFWAWGQPWEWYLKFNPITSLPIYWWRLSPNFIPLALQVWEEFAKNHRQELKDSLL